MKILVMGGTGHVSRLVDELRARGVDVRVLARQHRRIPLLSRWRSRPWKKMFLLNAVNARAHAGVGRIRVDAASRHSSRDLLLDFPGQPVPQRSAFRRQGGSGKRTAEFWRAAYRHPRGLLVPERETLQGEAYGKEILPWYLPQLKKFSAANPNAVWAIG